MRFVKPDFDRHCEEGQRCNLFIIAGDCFAFARNDGIFQLLIQPYFLINSFLWKNKNLFGGIFCFYHIKTCRQ